LYKPREPLEHGSGGPVAGAAALSYAQMVIAPVHGPVRGEDAPPAAIPHPLTARWTAWRQKAEAKFHQLDIAIDLAEDIGWLRGMGTMLALGAVALAFWPDFSALQAATTMTVDTQTREEFRSQMIRPLALGGDSGRHMAATSLVTPLTSAPERAMIQMTATLGQGDSFGRMLQRAGVGAVDAAQVTEMVAAAVPLGDITPGTRFDITLGHRTAPGRDLT